MPENIVNLGVFVLKCIDQIGFDKYCIVVLKIEI